MHQVTTPAGTFQAAVIKTEYEIDILKIVSVRDTLYTFYAEGVGKVAEAERRRVVMGLLKTDTKVGKVLLSFTPVRPPSDPAPHAEVGLRLRDLGNPKATGRAEGLRFRL